MNIQRVRTKIATEYLTRIFHSVKKPYHVSKIYCNSVLNDNISSVRYKKVSYQLQRFYSNENKSDDNTDNQFTTSRPSRLTHVKSIASRYKIFQDLDSPVILDVDEERQLLRENPELLQEQEVCIDPFVGLNVERGVTGVFDIEELVDVLRNENAKHIMTIQIPSDRHYADYMVVVTGKSHKHMHALVEFIRKLYKKKRRASDKVPAVEGDKESDWLALDLGNIALHIFTRETRKKYDLELLWTAGRDYDDQYNRKDEGYIALLKKHTHPLLEGLVPADSQSTKEEKLCT